MSSIKTEPKMREKKEQGEQRQMGRLPEKTEEDSPQDLEPTWANTQDSILGDRPYILPNGEIYKKRVRTVMTPIQSEALKKYFKINAFPSSEERAAISERLEMKPRTVQIWFQNQRQKVKHIMKEEEKFKSIRAENMYTGRKGEETLWVLAYLSSAIYSTTDV